MEVVEWVLGGQVQQDIVMMINEAGGKAVGLTGKDGGLIRARKKLMDNKENPSQPLDIGFVGDITQVEPAVVKALQDDQFIPVISPIGYGQDGKAYNINADVVGREDGRSAGRGKLLMMTNTPGVLDKNGWLLRSLSARAIDELFADGTYFGRHAAEDLLVARRGAQRREFRAHHRWTRAALPAAGTADGPGRGHPAITSRSMQVHRVPATARGAPAPLPRRTATAAPARLWLFDLDNTLHDTSHAIFPRIDAGMTRAVAAGAGRGHRYGQHPADHILEALRRNGHRHDASPRRECRRLPAHEPRFRCPSADPGGDRIAWPSCAACPDARCC